jgi:hypothetical protein
MYFLIGMEGDVPGNYSDAEVGDPAEKLRRCGGRRKLH